MKARKYLDETGRQAWPEEEVKRFQDEHLAGFPELPEDLRRSLGKIDFNLIKELIARRLRHTAIDDEPHIVPPERIREDLKIPHRALYSPGLDVVFFNQDKILEY